MRLTWISLTGVMAAVLLSGAIEMSRGPDPTAASSRLVAASALQSRWIARMAPIHLLWAACGCLGGLVLRDRVAATRSHSSPTAAWLAKRAIAASASAAAAFGLGAVRMDPAWLHAIAALHAVGWLAYVRNLPARL